MALQVLTRQAMLDNIVDRSGDGASLVTLAYACGYLQAKVKYRDNYMRNRRKQARKQEREEEFEMQDARGFQDGFQQAVLEAPGLLNHYDSVDL